MIKDILSRFRSWATWAAIAGAVWLILSATGVNEKLGITGEAWTHGLNTLSTLLTAFGILNNPTNHSGM